MNSTQNGTWPPGSNTDDIIVVSIWSTILIYALVANILVLVGIMRSTQMRSATSYWFIISLAICDVVMVLISLLHLVPATAFHEQFVGLMSKRNIIAIFVYDLFWYTAVLKLGLMAVNRFVSIVYPMDYKIMFSPKRTKMIIGSLYMVGLAVSVPTLFPCCHTVYNSRYYITIYEPEDTDYSWVDVAVNSFTVILMVFCYSVILYKVRKNQKAMAKYRLTQQRKKEQLTVGTKVELSPQLSGASTVSRVSRTVSNNPQPRPTMSRRELRLFLQFFIVSLVFLLTWSTWQWLPRISVSKWIYFTLTSFFFINNSVNPTVYFFFNSTLRREVYTMLCNAMPEQLGGEKPFAMNNSKTAGKSSTDSASDKQAKKKLIAGSNNTLNKTDSTEPQVGTPSPCIEWQDQIQPEHIVCVSSTV